MAIALTQVVPPLQLPGQIAMHDWITVTSSARLRDGCLYVDTYQRMFPSQPEVNCRGAACRQIALFVKMMYARSNGR